LQEFVLAEGAVKIALRLITVMSNTLVNKLAIKVVVLIHSYPSVTAGCLRGFVQSHLLSGETLAVAIFGNN
jgi:hypothetical protein